MFCLKPLSLCRGFIEQLNESLKIHYGKKLTLSQRTWLSLCLTGILITNSVCWQRIERMTIGGYKARALSKMFRRAKISWMLLFQASIQMVLSSYGITRGVLALDDTANKRSKHTKRISKTHKTKDKSTGGYFNGQELVILLLITEKVTIPVGFGFYEPQPEMTAWRKTYNTQKRNGVPKSQRVKKPAANYEKYPTKAQIALNLIADFTESYPQVKIQCILADALYGSSKFFCKACAQWGVQVISQVRYNQKVKSRGKFITVADYFNRYSFGVSRNMLIRGTAEQSVTIDGARLFLKAHGCKRYIVAIKYEGEENYRYLVASDLTWRLTDIASAYTLRWLAEVFIQDWKLYEGWCQLAKQQGEDGSSRGLILSLLSDHCLLLHPEQKALVNNKLPALTVGSLRDLERINAVIESIQSLVSSDKANPVIESISEKVAEVIPLRQSAKHMSGRDLGRLGPSESLRYRKAA